MELWEEIRMLGEEIDKLPSEKVITVTEVINNSVDSTFSNNTTRNPRNFESDKYRRKTSVNN